MSHATTLSVVTPCYNEERTLPLFFYRLECLQKILKDDYQIEFVLVNDGSQDQTANLLEEGKQKIPQMTLLHHDRNRGFGAALKTGLQHAQGDIVVTVDADTNYDHLEIPRLLTFLTPDYDMVTASPFHPEGRWHYPFHRYFMSRGVVSLYRFSLRGRGQSLSTFTSGLRAYRRSILNSIIPEADDFLATAELLVRALLKGYRVNEFPTTVYPRHFGVSKLKTFRTMTSHLKFMHRIYFNGLN